jgi:tetratricopeptide (TPR) repeat protein
LNRREFLTLLAALPAFAQAVRRDPPYLALKKFIEPGVDEFPMEKRAAEVRAALHTHPHNWGKIRRTQFFPLPDGVIRYEAASEKDGKFFYRTGHWRCDWESGKPLALVPLEEQVTSSDKPYFRDVTDAVLGFDKQLSRGIPYWRSRLDPASGIDIYGSNGIAVGDIDGDSADEIYICQPGGLPNRLFKFGEDGRAIDITQAWGAGFLDDTSSALFLDLRNVGRQDLVVLRASGPVLLINDGVRFSLRTDAFQFATRPQGGFTGMAAADFDRDGKLDLYLCSYVYFQSEAQYTYASPYHDAQNGPPNFLFRNRLAADGSGVFEDATAETGVNENNNRFSFAPAWCDSNRDGWPDLYVANDFGRKNFYVNTGGHFRDRAAEAGVEDIGPGMSASWFDYDGDGRPDLYVANMWTAAGQRVIRDPQFTPAKEHADAYRRHTMGNSLFRNRGDGTFEDVTARERAAFGRWAWAAEGHDLDNDGQPEIFVTCGMLTNESETDLNSFFWRQVVAHSPTEAKPSAAYENGWNAINQFIREDYSWNGHEPNVLLARKDGKYVDVSGVSGLDFAGDSRAFAVVDFDGDGRPDIILKSRLGPQVRFLRNDWAGENHSIAFSLRGTKSNRDAIGSRLEVDGRTKWLSAGSGFLSQHSKRMIFGLGTTETAGRVRITWPSGTVQEFSNLQAGKTYTIVEGSSEIAEKEFRRPRALPSGSPRADNSLALEDTWFLEPVPLPEPQHGPGLFVIDGGKEEYQIFRRYLFDWRTGLSGPLALLLNASGQAVKVYAKSPTKQQVEADLRALARFSPRLGLPFAGDYINTPHRDFFKFGAAYLWSGYSQQALPYLEQVLRRTPDNARVLVLVGRIHLEATRLDEAEKNFREALHVNAANAEAWSGLGDVCDARKDPRQASEQYDKALALKPDLLYTLLNAGQVADKLERPKQAEDFYRRAFTIDPQMAEAANGLGLALAKQGQPEEARKYFERAIALQRDFSGAINNLGVLYIQQGKTDDAIAAFEYGLRVAPGDDILYLNLARLYVQRGNVDRARELMRKLLERKPGSKTARHALEELSGR